MSQYIPWLVRRQGSIMSVLVDPAKLSSLTDAEFFSCQPYIDQYEVACGFGRPVPATPPAFWKLILT